ncbi:MAG: DinB family protein [Thermoanaerobaculia bacterium]
MNTIQEFLRHFRRQRGWTRGIVEAVPPEHFDWAPAEGAFSCGDLIRHLMQAEIFWTRMIVHGARGESFDPFAMPEPPGVERMTAFRPRNLETAHNPKYGTTVEECLARWSEISAETERRLSEIPDAALGERRLRHPLAGFEGPLWEFLVGMLEHEAHHRGQLSAYLKMLGAPQPAGAWDESA